MNSQRDNNKIRVADVWLKHKNFSDNFTLFQYTLHFLEILCICLFILYRLIRWMVMRIVSE